MRIDLQTVIGENGITLEDGQKVYEIVHPELLEGHPVELNFADVKVVASPFFNAAIGPLLKDIQPADLNRLLKFEHLSPIGQLVLRRVIENAKRYYMADENTRRAADQILMEKAGEE